MTDLAATTPRPRCPQCLRALRGCICALVHPVHTDVQVLILQHPMELHEAKGTARALHLCLGPQSRLEVGEAFDGAQLTDWLYAPWQPGDAPRQPVLLYPESPEPPSPSPNSPSPAKAPDSPANSTAIGPAPTALRLVVIDGTWRKSLKMLHANPALQSLPRLPLHVPAAGRYRIRKARRADQLSTLEASTLALGQLQWWGDGAAPLMALERVFDELLGLHERLLPMQPLPNPIS